MKLSMGFFTQLLSSTCGTGHDFGGTKAQCFSYFAPCFIHFLTRSTSCGVRRFRLEFAGGIMSEVSLVEMRRKSSDISGLPGTSTCALGLSLNALKALSGLSSRRFACLLLASGPWHL